MEIKINKKTYYAKIGLGHVKRALDLLEEVHLVLQNLKNSNEALRKELDLIYKVADFIARDVFRGQFTTDYLANNYIAEKYDDKFETNIQIEYLMMLYTVVGILTGELAKYPSESIEIQQKKTAIVVMKIHNFKA